MIVKNFLRRLENAQSFKICILKGIRWDCDSNELYQKAEVFVIACDIPTFSPKLVYQLASKRGQNQVTIF